MHIQHNESTSGHTGRHPPPAHTMQSLHLTPDCEPDVQNPTQLGTQVSKTLGRYILRFISHFRPNIKYFFSLLD